jgi:hypothetical protein
MGASATVPQIESTTAELREVSFIALNYDTD